MRSQLRFASFALLAATTACLGSSPSPASSSEAGLGVEGSGDFAANDAELGTAEDAGGSVADDANTSSGPPAPPGDGAGGSDGMAPAVDAGAPGSGIPNVDGGPSTGCGKSGARTGDFTVSTTIAGVARSYEVLVQTTAGSNAPVPLVFVFHGLGGTSSGAEGFGLQMGAAAANDPAIFVFPQGLDQGNGAGWDLSCSGNDVAFFDAIRTKIESQYCIQANRVFVAGFSFGGDFTNSLGCCRGNVIRAVAPASGAFYINGSSCTAAAPSYRLTSGTADPYYAQSDFTNALNHYVKANGCSMTTSAVSPSPCVAYGGCKQPVIWCSYSGMMHQLPANWPNDAWSFLSKFK